MNTYTHFEDLSTEIFFEIFDYLHALDIFTSFTSLNKRISSILQIIPLGIVIASDHCRYQIDFLSSHLTYHAHQVTSLTICDTIRNDTSIISLLFNQHNFINLESCTFISIESSRNLEHIIQQVESLNRLVSFSIYQPKNEDLNVNDKNDFTRTMLTHKSSFLRSITLKYPNDYLNIFNYTSIPSNLISFKLSICGSSSALCVYSILPILRFCHRLQHLVILITYLDVQNDNNIDISSQTASLTYNDSPILSELISFELIIFTRCDIDSIGCILHCMPNLRHFYFVLTIQETAWPFPGELLDGNVWEQIFEIYVPHLSKFEFYISIAKGIPQLNLKLIVNSFENFVKKYSNWHMIINRWKIMCRIREEFVILRTLNYHKHKSNITAVIPFIFSRSFQMESTMTTKDHYLFYDDIKQLRICMMKTRPTITWSSPLFQQVNHLIISMPRSYSIWKNLLNIFNFTETNDNDTEQTITDLSYFIHLPNVTHVEFASTFKYTFRWKDIQLILQACPKVTNLTIDTQLLFLSKLFDNPCLISTFKQIKMIQLKSKNFDFPSNFALKFVQRFPSLSNVELEVFSFHDCVSFIDIFLTELEHLSYIKINYSQDTLVDDSFLPDYIIGKRHQRYSDHNLNQQMISINNNGKFIEIWLQ